MTVLKVILCYTKQSQFFPSDNSTQPGESNKINDVRNFNHPDKGQYASICNF